MRRPAASPPITLTSITTFAGLAPMIFETSRQARFLIPMAISLGFGLLFATAVVLVMMPAMYVLLDRVGGLPDSRKVTTDLTSVAVSGCSATFCTASSSAATAGRG